MPVAYDASVFDVSFRQRMSTGAVSDAAYESDMYKKRSRKWPVVTKVTCLAQV